ncbi:MULTISPECIES: hypothetical protein [Sutcliffiella]|uniref:hypothetical protein n=1 Tax=Sutcliffiella TaxID=2837511 RepID=UPI0022DD58BC|nr:MULTISPECIES: hypothetical protein [Sutcliffiella]MED4014875.1 hypothetical protein [Sutcliffiella cohnii]WBL17384.1 hypothetical protein O1A01_12430 [Sutcliffiella sp. NC1]
MKIRIQIYLLIFLLIVLSACGAAIEDEDNIIDKSIDTIGYLQTNDWDQLAQLVHPEKGLLFSANAQIEVDDVLFSNEEVALFGKDEKEYSFSPQIETTPANFINNELLSKEGVQVEYTVSSFDQSQVPNNIDENNIEEAYPDAQFVEYYSPPSTNDEDNWQAIRLVFEKERRHHYLVAIVRETPAK